MRQTSLWERCEGKEFLPPARRSFQAHLTHYTAEVCEWGQGEPLVLVPGMAGGFELLGPLISKLQDSYRVISYQIRSEEGCFALRQPHTLSDLAHDLDELIQFMRLETPTVFGVSFGGVVALDFACRLPHRLSRLIVQGVGATLEEGTFSQIASTVLSRFPLPIDNGFVNQFFNLLFGGRRRRDPLHDFVVRRCWQTDQGVMAHRFRMVREFNIEQRLGRIRVPTLVMAGDRDVLVSARTLSALCHGIPNVRFARLRRAGHLVSITNPDLINEHVQQFTAA